MKTQLHLQILAGLIASSGIANAQIQTVENTTPGNLNIRTSPSTSCCQITTVAQYTKLISSGTTFNDNLTWNIVDIPSGTQPNVFYGASGSNYLQIVGGDYIEVTSNVPNGLNIRETAGTSGNLLWIGNNTAAVWYLPSLSRGQRFAVTGNYINLSGDHWWEIYLPHNYCTVGQGGPFVANDKGWICRCQDQLDGPYTTNPLNITVHQKGLNITLFPNPGNGVFKISGVTSDIQGIQIVNGLGQVILQKTVVNSNNVEIDITGQPAGIYFCLASLGDGKIERKKFILQ